jgi:hypothetical protein
MASLVFVLLFFDMKSRANGPRFLSISVGPALGRQFWSVPMAVYWCRFLDRDSRAYAAEKFICGSVEEAVAKARAILVQSDDGSGFELWENAKRIYIEQPSPEKAD